MVVCFKTIVTQCLLNTRKYAFRRNPPFGVTASVFVHGSTCITIAISVNIMHIAVFNVGKQKRHFSTSKLTKSLSCNHKHKTYVSTSNVINSLSYTPQRYCMILALRCKRYNEYDITDRVQNADTKEVHTFLWPISP